MLENPIVYYHGTWDEYAAAIMSRGFELGHEGLGNLLGRGVYIAQNLAAAALWTPSDMIIRCTLAPATRILWVDEQYDRRVIRYLEREFGRDLLELGPHFHRAIPANKHLTQTELIHLCGYVVSQMRKKRGQAILRSRKGKKSLYFDSWQRLSRLHEQLKRHGYDALGDRSFAYWDADEVIVFDPARVQPLTAHRLYRQEGPDQYAEDILTLLEPLSADQLADIARLAQEEELEEE